MQMRIRFATRLRWGLFSATALVVGCNAVLDINDVQFSDDTTTAAGAGTETGTNSGSGTPSGGTGATGGSGGSGFERCTNGTDDDGDGAVDCADSDCGSFACAPAAPDGWSGPVVGYVGDPDALPLCSAPWAVVAELNAGLVSQPASCADCSCSAPAGGSCGQSTLSIYDHATACTVLIGSYGSLSDGSCVSASIAASNSARAATPPVLSQGFCAETGGAILDRPVTWTTALRLCGGSYGGGCDGTDVCVPSPEDPFMTVPCIYQAGDLTCPEGFDDKHLGYADVDDTRACSLCSCGSASGGTCVGEVRMYENSSCTAQRIPVPANGATCTPITIAASSVALDIPAGGPTGGGCTATGGTATGSAAASQPTTICCSPASGAGGAGGGA